MRLIPAILMFFLSCPLFGQNEITYDIIIDEEVCKVTPKRLNLESLPVHLIGITTSAPIFSSKAFNWGLIQPIHYYYNPKNNYHIYSRLMFSPFNNHTADYTTFKYRFFRIEAETIGNYYFGTKDKVKKNSSLNLRDPQGVVHHLKIEWPSAVRFAARFGLNYQQYALFEENVEAIDLADQQINRTTAIRGIQQTYLSIGIGREQIKGSSADFCSLGKHNTLNIRSWYIDLLYAPIQQIYGFVSDTIIATATPLSFDEQRLAPSTYETYRIGARLGYKRIGTWVKLPKVLLSTGGEIGFYPGLKNYNIAFSVTVAAHLGINRKQSD